MSGAERVQSFNPIIALLWVLQIIIFAMDYQDGSVSWSIPVIGSFLLVQIYMVWKTNWDAMQEEYQTAEQRRLGGTLVEDTPVIQPGITVLPGSQKQKPSSGPMINLGFAPGVENKEKGEE